MTPFVIKYDYEDMYGFGATIVFAEDIDSAVETFKQEMFNKKDSQWIERTYHHSTFRHVAKNIFGWHTYFNDPANVCVKVREVNTKYGTIIPIQEHFEEGGI